MKQVSMHVASLTLDEINPRHAKQTASLEESIAALLDKGSDKILRLARDIIQHGVNPTELVVVMSEGDRNIVLEGNRRVAALKLLHKPTLAPTEQLQKKFAAIARSGEAPRRVQCITAESRIQAAHWIRLRHTGENNGIGVVRWSTGEASRFGGRSTPTEKARLFIDAISNLYAEDSELLADVAAVRDSRITTLGRMIGDPEVRSRLGLSFDEDVVLCSFPKHKMKPIISQLFRDLAGTLSVDRIKSKRQREDYLRHVEDKLPKLADRLDEPEKFSRPTNGGAGNDIGSSETADDTNAKPPRRKRADFEKRLFQSVTLRHVTLRTSEVLEEAKQLSIDDMPNVAAIMVRIVVDIVVTDVAEQLGWKRNQGDLKSRIGAVLNQADPTKDDPSLSDAWRFSQKEEGALVLKTLHSFIHSWQSNPLTSEVRKLSMAYSPLLIKADELLAKKKR
ncbi:hypothetical protein [Streptomyces sp. MOE7]|uniref:hypothetical protein n=1 Tax=Streptomyces sp. MOE7 TaxID=1961713 RepID=UPI000A06CF9E|nr:hypothetical protein [Streptomyces sp. MOE7]ARH92306.1 hypothetical protein STRMOE7_20620 [Streptomyces sp. MOE7]